jgi:hypothetical protein
MKYAGSIISLLVVALLVWGAIEFKDTPAYYSFKAKLDNVFQKIVQYVQVTKHNIMFDVSSERKPPATLIDKEAKLQAFLYPASEEFQRFDDKDWQQFYAYLWNLIYGATEEEQGSFEIKRHRSKDEIEEQLIHDYPDPFSRLQRQHWNYFWNITLGE